MIVEGGLKASHWVGRTLKDSQRKKTTGTAIVVSRRNDGTFDLVVNEKLVRSSIPEIYLEEELSLRFGLCGEECASIVHEIERQGRTTITLSSDGPKFL